MAKDERKKTDSPPKRADIIYSPAWWIPGGHLQTLWGKFFRRQPAAPTRIERWDTPDGDFLDVHRIDSTPGTPRVLVLHGLEGTIRSHYAQALLNEAIRRGWGADLLLFRSCGPELNRAKRFYHSGETEDVSFVLERITKEYSSSPLAIVGVSLGGNVLLKFLGERGNSLPAQLKAAAAVSVPYDLFQSSVRINRGFSRVYQHYFLGSLRRKALEKAIRYPDLGPIDRIRAVKTLAAFDDLVTGPLHGFRDAEDYYRRSSSLRYLERIRLKTLLLSAADDPMLPSQVLNQVRRIADRNPALQIDFPAKGGHAGFVAGSRPWRPFYYAEHRVGEFFADAFNKSSPWHAVANQESR